MFWTNYEISSTKNSVWACSKDFYRIFNNGTVDPRLREDDGVEKDCLDTKISQKQ